MNAYEKYHQNIDGFRDRSLEKLRRRANLQKIRTEELISISPKELLKEVGYYD